MSEMGLGHYHVFFGYDALRRSVDRRGIRIVVNTRWRHFCGIFLYFLTFLGFGNSAHKRGPTQKCFRLYGKKNLIQFYYVCPNKGFDGLSLAMTRT